MTPQQREAALRLAALLTDADTTGEDCEEAAAFLRELAAESPGDKARAHADMPTVESPTRETDSTGAMAAAWFGTLGAEKAVEAVFGRAERQEPQTEPVAEVVEQRGNAHFECNVLAGSVPAVGTKLYAHPPQRKPLNLATINRMTYAIDEDRPATGQELIAFARAVEAAHGIKEPARE